jgi:hypothetical protein
LRQHRRARIIIVGIALIIGGLITYLKVSEDISGPTDDWKVGQCVTPGGTAGDQTNTEFTRTGCDASKAAAKVTKMTTGGMGITPNCPEDTDAIINASGSLGGGTVACIRNLKAPHPGDAGQGGGQFRAGDCLQDPETDLPLPENSTLNEVPCASPHWATVTRLSEDAASCPKGGSNDVVPTTTFHEALCVRRG